MKRNIRSVSWLMSACSIAAAVSVAQAQEEHRPGFYFQADLGPAFTEDAGLTGFSDVPPGAEVQFDVGTRVGISGGYTFTPWLAAEVETGWAYNSIDRITGASVAEASLSNMPLLGNVVLQYPNRTRFVPFIGGGAGMVFSVLDVDVIATPNFLLTGNEVDTVFAYQGFAGVRYNIDERMDVGIAYKFLGTSDPSWDVFPGEKLRLNELRTHSVNIAFRLRF